MSQFDLEKFAIVALAEALFYDEEYGAIGAVSLVDGLIGREAYIASYSPDDEVFLIEEATAWESYSPNGDDAIGYRLAIDSSPHSSRETPMEAAEVLLGLARADNLEPSVSLMFEVEDPGDD